MASFIKKKKIIIILTVVAKTTQKLHQQEQMLRRPTFKCKITKIMLVLSLKYTQVTQSMMCLILLMRVATMHH